MRPSRSNMFWGEVRQLNFFSFCGRVVLMTLIASMVMEFSLVESAALGSESGGGYDEHGGISRESILRQLRERENLKNMKIMMAPGGGEDLVDESGGLQVRDDDDEQVASASDVVEILQDGEGRGVLPKTLEAAEMLMERYKENMKDDGHALEGHEDQPRNLYHHHHPSHHRHPPPQQQEDGEVPQEKIQAPSLIVQTGRNQNGRSLWADDFEKKTSELCGTSASLECGKKILSLIEDQEMAELSVHMKCDLRDDFLKCIDTQKSECLELSRKSSLLPQLPPKEVIKMERTKLWRVLWTAGGCVLAD